MSENIATSKRLLKRRKAKSAEQNDENQPTFYIDPNIIQNQNDILNTPEDISSYNNLNIENDQYQSIDQVYANNEDDHLIISEHQEEIVEILGPSIDPDLLTNENDNLVQTPTKENKTSKSRNPFRRGRKNILSDKDKAKNNKDQKDSLEKQTKTHRRYNQYFQNNCLSMFQFLLQSNLSFNLGYRIDKMPRFGRYEEKHPNLHLETDTDGLAVGINVLKLNFYGKQLASIVKPYVKIHVVSIETGYYITSRKFPAVIPVSTNPCILIDSTTSPSWNQELIFDAYFSDLVSEDNILLFEVLDEKPSLSTTVKKSKQTTLPLVAKRIAWGFLLPISVSGDLNIGFSDDWKLSSRRGIDLEIQKEQDSNDNTNPDEIIHRRLKTINENDPTSPKITPRNTPKNSPRQVNDETEDKSKSSPTKKQKYPWDKPSIDKFIRIQLYSYRHYDGFFGLIQRKILGWPTIGKYIDNGESHYPNGIPEVYIQWRLQMKNPIEGAYLSVEIGPRPAELMPYILSGQSGEIVLSTGNEKGLDEFKHLIHKPVRRGRLWAGINGAPKSKSELNKLRTSMLKRSRNNREPCVVPDKLLYRYDVGDEGAMVVSFSHSGHILAIASKGLSYSIPLSRDEMVYNLTLYDTDLNEEVWIEPAAHHGVVYEIKWTKDDRFMLTCSSDGTCKVWNMLPLSYRSNNMMGFGALINNSVGNVISNIDLSSSNSNIDQLKLASSKPPSLVYILASSPPIYTYTAVFQELPSKPQSALLDQETLIATSTIPRIITGAADGKLRVWDGNHMKGYIYVAHKDKNGMQEIDESPHEGAVNSVVIDERSRYLISGDALGEILAWRVDVNGWYQLLRKFRRDTTANPTSGLVNSNTNGCVMSLVMHPDKHKGLMLSLMRQPAQLKVINMSTYKTHCVCAGFNGYSTSGTNSGNNGIFARSQLSADGKYIIAGSSVKSENGMYKIQVWETQTGHIVRTHISDIMFPYPIRSLSWHPTQHLLAVAMVGHGAAVVVYSGDRENADKAVERANADSAYNPIINTSETISVVSNYNSLNNTLNRNSNLISSIKENKVQFSGIGNLTPLSSKDNSPLKGKVNIVLNDKAREVLERIKAAKAYK